MTEDFVKRSHAAHARLFDAHVPGGAAQALGESWLDGETVDAWRHEQMYRSLDPIVECEPGATWLTVGDGRYATDAAYLLRKGATVVASDISDTLLKEAKARGLIPSYAVVNAEAIDFEDGAFEYVFCKEAYHHFPRPTLALHEMLRVASKGVVLIEPNDRVLCRSIRQHAFQKLKGVLKTMLGRPAIPDQFEEAGNFIYSISRREMEKVALGMNLRVVAFRPLHDCYLPGANEEKTRDRGPVFRRIRRTIALQRVLCALGLEDSRLLAAIVFKQPPNGALVQALQACGYDVVPLPENPYAA